MSGSKKDCDTVISFSEVVVNNPQAVGGDGESLVANFDFTNKQIRQGFIRKVYAIVLVQLALTAGVMAWFMYDARLLRAVADHGYVFLGVTVGTYLTTLVCVACCEGPRRRVPYNYVFLLLLTLSLSALLGLVCTLFDVREVLIAGGITFAIVAALTIFAVQTKVDFTVMSGSILCLCLVLLLFGVTAAFSPAPALRQAYCALGVFVISVFLVYDTQLIVAGKHRYAFSPEEYVFAALTLYLDIVHIFVRVLQLMR